MYKVFYKKFIYIIFLFSLSFNSASAANISVSPLIIDYSTEARDLVTKDITIKNNQTSPVRLYASVNEIELDGNNEIKSFIPASMSDRTQSVTSWIEISRARIDLQPGEEKTIPITIRINPNARPGEYHAFVGFGAGSNIDEATKQVMANQASGVVVRVSINSKQTELLKLNNFQADKFVLSNKAYNFTFQVENLGDVPQTPSGEIIIYNSRGEEINSVAVNADKKTIQPNETFDFSIPIPFSDKFGKNKAYLSISYGEKQINNIYDINFYYTIPWVYLVVLLSLLTIIPLFITIALKRLFGNKHSNVIYQDEAMEVPLFVRKHHEHETFDHDINLKKNDS